DGIDGSGSHAIYNQKNSGNKDDFNKSSKNILSYMFVPLQLTNLNTSQIVWQEEKMNSSEVCRPLLLVNAKETKDVLKEIIPAIQKEAYELQITGLEIKTAEGGHIKIYCDIQTTMIDGKMHSLLLGTGKPIAILEFIKS
ncbi:unnamed protein product, partial [Meganyctiphanes norvegica]